MVFLSCVHAFDWDNEEVTAKQEGKEPPDKFEIFYVSVFVVMLEDVTYLFINEVFVLTDKDNCVAKLPVLCEENNPFGTSFLIP